MVSWGFYVGLEEVLTSDTLVKVPTFSSEIIIFYVTLPIHSPCADGKSRLLSVICWLVLIPEIDDLSITMGLLSRP
jgi:hypothetical protein